MGDSLDPADPLNSACNIFLKRGRGEGKTGTNGANDGSSGSSRSTSNSNSTSETLNNGDSTAAEEGSEEPASSTPTNTGSAAVTVNTNDSNGEDGGGGVAVVLCGCRVPPSQADAWAKALLDGIDAEVVVALTTVTAEPGRSEAWQGARLIATAEAEEREDCLKVINFE